MFPYSGPGGNALSVAQGIDAQVGSVLALVLAWRTTVNDTGVMSSLQAQNVYQALTALHAYVGELGQVPGLKQAYQFLFPTIGDFNPGAEWNAARLAIEDFVDWFQSGWPEKTASGKPALNQYQLGPAGSLTLFTVNLNAPQKTALVGKLDAVLAAFVTP